MKQPHRERARVVHCLLFGLVLLLGIPVSFSQAQAVMPMTPSGLHTTVSAPISLPSGQTQFDITGGTRPGGGANLFHSFGDFNVPNHNIANFLNDSGLATSNILGRVTGGNISNIFGTIQTTGFGNANLFLMNPAGFLFGPTATVNVGGMMTFTSANYLKLADGVRFNATPSASADLLLSAAPVAAFGFLGSNPGAITVQGSQLTVAEGTGLSLVGGNITVQAGTLTAPSGQINLVSVGKPSHPNVGGEVVVAGSGQGSGFTPTGFASMGAISLAQGSTVDTSAIPDGHSAGNVVIRGGQFVMDNSSIEAGVPVSHAGALFGGNVEVTAEQVALSNHSRIDTSTGGTSAGGSAGNVTFNVDTFSATDSAIVANGGFGTPGFPGLGIGTGGAVTIQGLQGTGTSAHSVSLTNTGVSTMTAFLPFEAGGPIVIRSGNIALNQSSLNASAFEEGSGGVITLVSSGRIESHDSSITTGFFFIGHGSGGTVDLQAGAGIELTNTIIDAHASVGLGGGTITMVAPSISISDSRLDVRTGGEGNGGTISLTGTKAVSLTNDTLVGVSEGIGGTLHVEANKVSITDSQLNTSVVRFDGAPQVVGGSITINAKNTTLTNSQILSTATDGQGGTIDITSHVLHQDTSSVIDASSQSGTNGTVTINGVIQP